jgi:hypothetical protein
MESQKSRRVIQLLISSLLLVIEMETNGFWDSVTRDNFNDKPESFWRNFRAPRGRSKEKAELLKDLSFSQFMIDSFRRQHYYKIDQEDPEYARLIESRNDVEQKLKKLLID